jgi:hypothetical protein
MSSEAWTPTRAAFRLTTQLNVFAEHHGVERFPVDVTTLAREAAHLFSWSDPITEVKPANIDRFEGALFPNEGRTKWMLLYNQELTSSGRIRFTQAHELGHYILHRMERDGFQCTDADMLDWSPGEKNIESESDTFASYLLMPLDDYRVQTRSAPINLDLFSHCADRYGVSLTASILKWLEHTEESAVFVMSRDGYIDWAWSSQAAMRAGAYFKTRNCPPKPLPAHSLAANEQIEQEKLGQTMSSNVWFPKAEEQFPLREMKLRADQYDSTLTLLHLPRSAKAWARWQER